MGKAALVSEKDINLLPLNETKRCGITYRVIDLFHVEAKMCI